MASAAARQDRLQPFADAFYRNQGQENSGYVTVAFLTRVGEASGPEVDSALAGRDGAAGERWLAAAERTGKRHAVQSTPAFSPPSWRRRRPVSSATRARGAEAGMLSGWDAVDLVRGARTDPAS
jgi:hypothetical protein